MKKTYMMKKIISQAKQNSPVLIHDEKIISQAKQNSPVLIIQKKHAIDVNNYKM
jgi:hypothetical protein